MPSNSRRFRLACRDCPPPRGHSGRSRARRWASDGRGGHAWIRQGGRAAEGLDGIVAEGAPSAIAEVRDGDRVWRVGSGVADHRGGRQAVAGDRFRAGSVTKTFVATVVLQLVGEGRIGLDDPVGRHLPGLVPDGDDGMPVTVRQLLNHTSGIPNYTDALRRGHDPIRRLQHSHYTPASWSESR